MKSNPVQRIKLMMSYDMSKTLNENLITTSIINENEDEIEEQGALALAKDLKLAKSVESKIPALARFFNITDDVAKLAYAKDLTTLGKEVEKAIANDIKNGFKGNGAALGPLTKEVSKQQAIKEILSADRKLSEAEIIEIIERWKSVNKQKAGQAEVKAGLKSSSKDAKTAATDVKTGATDVKAAEAEIKAGVTNATKQEAEVVLTNTIKEVSPEIKPILEANKSRIRQMSEKAFEHFKKAGKRLGAKWLIGLGLAGAGGVYLLSRIFGGTTRPDGTNTIHPKCITDLLDDEGSSVSATTGGDPVVMVTKTGNQEYDALGGLKFYTNGRVISMDNSKKGYWSCKDGEVAVQNETLNEQISDATMDADVSRMIDLLDFPVTGGNLQDALTLLTKYSNSPRGKEFLDLYKDSGLGGGDLKKSLDYVITTQPASVRAKRALYGLISKIESGEVTGDNNKNTGVGNINIKWDDTTNTGDSSNTDDSNKTDGRVKTGRFVDCESQPLPHKFGCKSSKILEVQKCLGITSDGKFGPNTLKALIDAKHAVTESGLTQEIYDLVIKNCKPTETKPEEKKPEEVKPTETKPQETKPEETKVDPTKPMTPPETPAEPVYDRNRLQELLAGKELVKKRNGTIIKWKGPELDGNDYYILNKYLTDRGYIQKSQREVGDRDDEDVTMRYKWKKTEEQ